MFFADKHLNFNALLGIHYEVVWATARMIIMATTQPIRDKRDVKKLANYYLQNGHTTPTIKLFT